MSTTPVEGPGRVVPLREAERELRSTWRALDEGSRRDHGEGMLRLRELNLVVVCSEAESARAQRTAALVTREHPARVLVVVQDGKAGEGARESSRQEATAAIVTACLVDPGSRRHVCSEEVVIRGGDADSRALHAAVLQLLVQDVPVVGWWAADIDADPAGLEWLGGICDRVVTDLARSADPVHAMAMLGRLADDRRAHVCELEWQRCLQWRVLTAEMFGQPENLALIPNITRLRIEHRHAPVQALLYGAWFASRLGLEASGGAWWPEVDALCFQLSASSERTAQPVDVSGEGDAEAAPGVSAPSCLTLELSPAGMSGDGEPALSAVRVRSASPVGTGEQALALRRQPGSCVCSAISGAEADEMVVKSLRIPRQDDHEHIARVIDTRLHDRVFESALRLAVILAEQPGFVLADAGRDSGA